MTFAADRQTLFESALCLRRQLETDKGVAEIAEVKLQKSKHAIVHIAHELGKIS